MKGPISLILLGFALRLQANCLPIVTDNLVLDGPWQSQVFINPSNGTAPPTFVGGQEALIRFIQANLQYPDEAKQSGLQGIVYVRARVLPSGNLDSLSVIYSRGKQTEETLGEEALRIVRLMPVWNPATNANGQHISEFVLIPFRFKLSPDK